MNGFWCQSQLAIVVNLGFTSNVIGFYANPKFTRRRTARNSRRNDMVWTWIWYDIGLKWRWVGLNIGSKWRWSHVGTSMNGLEMGVCWSWYWLEMTLIVASDCGNLNPHLPQFCLSFVSIWTRFTTRNTCIPPFEHRKMMRTRCNLHGIRCGSGLRCRPTSTNNICYPREISAN